MDGISRGSAGSSAVKGRRSFCAQEIDRQETGPLLEFGKTVVKMRADATPYKLNGYLTTDFSWKRSILLGIASIFDFTGRLGPQCRHIQDPAKKDALALGGDWRAVGDDFRRIIMAANNIDFANQPAD